jgi:hypothetical protein
MVNAGGLIPDWAGGLDEAGSLRNKDRIEKSRIQYPVSVNMRE